MAVSTMRQIAKTNTSNKLVEFNDKLQPNDFSVNGVEKSSPHGKYSRIEVTIVDFSKGKKEHATIGTYNLSPEQAKMIAHLVITGDIAEFEKPDTKLNSTGIVEQKINHYKVDEQGFSPVSKFGIRYQPQMNSPWTITIETGKGKAEKTTIGGTNIAKGSYQKESDCTIYISKREMYKMMIALKDYVENYERWSFKLMLETRNGIEIKQREDAKIASQKA